MKNDENINNINSLLKILYLFFLILNLNLVPIYSLNLRINPQENQQIAFYENMNLENLIKKSNSNGENYPSTEQSIANRFIEFDLLSKEMLLLKNLNKEKNELKIIQENLLSY
jgi:hypothetical protein